MKAKFLALLFIFSCSILPVGAINPDSTKISLLTLLPWGKEVYTIFGHTSIRVCSPSESIDVVFNYGTFDRNKPHFIYYYLRGKTDYVLDFEYFPQYTYKYTVENGTVIEQVLNIPSAEKSELIRWLEWNILPENREYLYDYFFDNCTTRPRDLIEKYCGGKLAYQLPENAVTFRQLVHLNTAPYPWLEFGIDLLIGSGADSLISYRGEMFLPVKLMEGLDKAIVRDTLSLDSERPIVSGTQTILHARPEAPAKDFFLSPPAAGVILWALCLVIGICGYVFKRPFRIFFGSLYLIAALVGSLVAFIAFFSIHPCTYPNYNLLWLHPLHWIAFASYCFKKSYSIFKWYHGANFVLLSLFLAGWSLIPQQLSMANIPFILCLWVASGWYFLGARYKIYGLWQKEKERKRIKQ